MKLFYRTLCSLALLLAVGFLVSSIIVLSRSSEKAEGGIVPAITECYISGCTSTYSATTTDIAYLEPGMGTTTITAEMSSRDTVSMNFVVTSSSTVPASLSWRYEVSQNLIDWYPVLVNTSTLINSNTYATTSVLTSYYAEENWNMATDTQYFAGSSNVDTSATTTMFFATPEHTISANYVRAVIYMPTDSNLLAIKPTLILKERYK